ncbi:ubiquitin carboxyl-terminal hydrolase MINDY-3 homolog [Uranotaenia lowii]|uniref:ubiquitin carboxyl-terminal hydrolase MINDY-3 homolog n=1 Tax=Uranotaenia lowii TaxID=190385 RepID=UPI0024790C8C|nr:ubiquitin carboxyl-terminal hydrolase MINDY-3 homolog [Uranotaenia lowii]
MLLATADCRPDMPSKPLSTVLANAPIREYTRPDFAHFSGPILRLLEVIRRVNCYPLCDAKVDMLVEDAIQQQQGHAVSSDQQPGQVADAARTSVQCQPESSEIQRNLREICQLLWSSTIKQEVFRRWSKTLASVSRNRFPWCSAARRRIVCVIAPVQTYLLKMLLMAPVRQ